MNVGNHAPDRNERTSGAIDAGRGGKTMDRGVINRGERQAGGTSFDHHHISRLSPEQGDADRDTCALLCRDSSGCVMEAATLGEPLSVLPADVHCSSYTRERRPVNNGGRCLPPPRIPRTDQYSRSPQGCRDGAFLFRETFSGNSNAEAYAARASSALDKWRARAEPERTGRTMHGLEHADAGGPGARFAFPASTRGQRVGGSPVRHERTSATGEIGKHRRRHSPPTRCSTVRTATRPARRIPLSDLFDRGRHGRRHPRYPWNGSGGDTAASSQVSREGGEDTADSPELSKYFAWSVLLPGCLCEAPLAVVEGLVRAPLYLVAAAWTAVVKTIGAHGRADRAAMLIQAAALAREGLLFLAASLTLAVPFSTTFWVYASLDPDDSWDVRPVPSPLGAVDPLRFFVFAFGQAGELAANGRPEPLSAHSEVSVVRESVDVEDRRARSSHPSSRGRVALVAPARSMDTDRLGAGIMLHPPQEVKQACSRALSGARRAAASLHRTYATVAARLIASVRRQAMDGTFRPGA